MVMVSDNFSELVDLDPVLTEIFFQQYEQVPMLLVPEVYGYRTSNKASETDMRLGGLRDPQPWKGQVFYDDLDRDSVVKYVHEHYTLGYKVERTLLEDAEFSRIFDGSANLGRSFARKRMKDEALPFELAFSSAAANAGYDGKPLVADDHPRSTSDSTAVDNYLGAKVLNEDNLEEARLQLESLGDDKGDITNAMATTLIVGRGNRRKAAELLGSPLSPETANNAINTNVDMNYIVHPAITGNKWFVVDSMMSQQSLKWIDRLAPQYGVADDESSTLVRSYYGRMRYSFGWSDFRWVVGSNPPTA